MKAKQRRIQISRQFILIFISILVLLPIFWTFVSTVRPRNQLMSANVFPALSDLTLDNYAEVLQTKNYLLFLKNSFIYGFFASAFSVMLGLMAAYSFSRVNFRFKKVLLSGFVVIMMIPALVVLVPIYMTFSKLKLLNPTGLIIVYAAGNIPFCLWLIKSFIDTIPREIDEAALIDGCTRPQVIQHVVLPLCKPGLASAFMIVFINCWNELLYADTFLNDMTLKPITSGLLLWKSAHGTDWAGMNTAALLACLPVLILFLVLQDYFVNGLVAGAVKG